MRSDKSRTSNEVGVAIEEIIKEFETNFKSRGDYKVVNIRSDNTKELYLVKWSTATRKYLYSLRFSSKGPAMSNDTTNSGCSILVAFDSFGNLLKVLACGQILFQMLQILGMIKEVCETCWFTHWVN